ncbi:MAG TPA: nucleotidyltransferase domain-containing protein [Daejeonella sp.]|nr:nucleotidyltransferase domain-containing protein [Daejeonella sp.]
MIAEILKDKLESLNELCRTHQVKTLYAFGSSVNDQLFSETSDIDLMVVVDVSDPLEKGEKLMSLWNNLELLFQRKVDLLTESSLKNPYLIDSINKTRVKIYDRSGEKVFT